MSDSLDPQGLDYRHRYQASFSRSAKRNGPAGVVQAQHDVSIWRAMRRRLLAGGKPSRRDFRPLRRIVPERFLLKSALRRLDRAAARGERSGVIGRRGLFEPLRGHRAYQFRAGPTPDKPFSLRAKGWRRSELHNG